MKYFVFEVPSGMIVSLHFLSGGEHGKGERERSEHWASAINEHKRPTSLTMGRGPLLQMGSNQTSLLKLPEKPFLDSDVSL
jgi:hypothetical protein